MMDKVRIGVTGMHRGSGFAQVFNFLEGSGIVSVHDIQKETAESAGADLGAEAFTDWDEFLDSGIDAVVISTPLKCHAEQAISALEHGIHVLSEVTACRTLPEAYALARAGRKSSAVYMFSENYQYLDEVELVKRMVADGRFGDVYYGEGEYLHDCQSLWYDTEGHLTWRGKGELGVYCTHSLGPLLYITGDRVVSVSCLETPAGIYDPDVTVPIQHVLLMKTAKGHMFKVRVDWNSRRPHLMSYYSVQGTGGSYEAARGLGDSAKVWVEDCHEPSISGASWHDLHAEFAEKYIADRLNPPEEAKAGGHGTSEYWLAQDFLAACRGERPAKIDLCRGLDYTVPGIVALESVAMGGAMLPVPDLRKL